MTLENTVKVGNVHLGAKGPFVLVAGPCVIEDQQTTFEIAQFLKRLCGRLDLPFIFKASYDKANRTALQSYRGPGLEKGLEILSQIKFRLNIPILSDVHTQKEIPAASEILDILQVPAFLCRQTDFLLAVGGAGKPVNVKKGQFLSPEDMRNVVNKIRSTGNRQVTITERGSMFGYNNLIVDFRGLELMRSIGCPIIFDATHSVQLPGGAGKHSDGQRLFAPTLARAAIAVGVDSVFMEVHPDPDKALCDGPNSLQLDSLESILSRLIAIRKAVATPCEIS